ncbi:MAG: nitroreductase family protein, partial [Myxococcota bacterium]
MNVHDVLRQRRTVHNYEDQPVDAAVVERALEAARWAPNHKLTNPWCFYVMGERTKARVAEVAAAIATDIARGAGADPERLATVAETARQKV